MARRFGRNQKRALRRELEATKAALERQETRNRSLLGDVVALRWQLSECTDALGEQFIGFEPHERAYMAVPDFGAFYLQVAGEVETMRVLELDVVRDDPRAQIHLRARIEPYSDVRYCISESALQRAPAASVARRVASEVAAFLLKQIREERARGHR